MRLTTVLLLATILHVSASGLAQNITFKQKNASFEQIVKEIRLQTGYNVLVSSNKIKGVEPQDVNFRNTPLLEVLRTTLKDQTLTFEIDDRTVLIKEKEPSFLDRVADALTPPIDISGLVLDEKGQPLAGVTVRVKGSSKATFTDNSGKFYLAGVDDDVVIELRMVGYKTLELPAKGKFGGVRMEVLSKELEEVVVAYGKTTQQALTGAVTVIKGEQIANLPYRSFDKALQGLVPGLQITQGTGQPGGGVASMVLRGISTGDDASFGGTFRNPLIVIDGIPVSQEGFTYVQGSGETPTTNPLAQINPSDIETISILKDAAAIALYGSKASNGVILVTTKTGKTGKTIFTFSHQTGFSSRPESKLEMLNQEEYLQLLYETYKNTPRVIGGISTPWTDMDILSDLKSKFPTRSDGSFYSAPDWEKELFTRNANTISNNISMSGGNEKNNFYLSFEYTKENGTVPNTGYDRKSMRFNFAGQPSKKLKLGTNTTLSYNIQQTGANGEVELGMSPLYPVRLEDGNYMFLYPLGLSSIVVNPVAKAAYNIDKNASYRGLSKFYAELRPIPSIILKSDLGVDYMLAELKQKSDPRFYNVLSGALPSIKEKDDRRTSVINTNSVSFSRIFRNIHSINLLIAQEARIITAKQLGAEANGTASTSPYYDQLNSSGYTMSRITGNSSRETLLSIFGQANYGYENKYFLSGSIRKDGSSSFGDQHQWGTYWSAGAGWIVTEEKMIKTHTTSWLDYLKIRGSMGAAGSSGALNSAFRFEGLSLRKFFGNQAVLHSTIGNPNIQWEETFTWDAGLEIKLFNERISLTADLYNKLTKGLIYQTNLPSLTGFQSVPTNIGNMKNSGVELLLVSTLIRNKNFNWNLSANWSTNKNVLVKAYVPLVALSSGYLANEEGRNFNSFYMPVWAGVNPVDGKPQWLDANGGLTSDHLGAAKSEFVGKPQPDGFGTVNNSFSYKGFGLSFMFYYNYGARAYNGTAAQLLSDGAEPYSNQMKQALNYWKASGDIAVNPRRLLNNSTDRGFALSTRYLSRGDYIRLQNVNLNYRFPSSLINRWGLNSVNVFLQGNNLALFTPYSGPDPDNASASGNTDRAYPIQRSFSVGLNVSF